jgi:hypothetical protein
MDTKTLVVGQDVYMVGGGYFYKRGKVVKVMPSGVDVQTGVLQIDGTWNAHELVRFDNSGKQCCADGTPAGNEYGGMPEFEPWELTDVLLEGTR